MAGIYIHIPFCKRACNYCDFHFSTNLSLQNDLVNAICKELKLKKDFLQNEKIETIYFGGGTPSLLTEIQLNLLLNSIYTNYSIVENPEITLEANPDDLHKILFDIYLKVGINRLSIGIQSFNNKILKWMNRAHNANQAEMAVKNAQDFGFKNISVDLIYAIPSVSKNDFNYSFETDLETFMDLKVPHISAYNLTIEPKTTFGNWNKKGILKTIEDEKANLQFDFLISELAKNGFEQYEISNFCQPEKHSIHNTSYWFGKKYIGIGPSAHSFDGFSRFANISHNANYIKSIHQNLNYQSEEKLSNIDFANEHLLTRLRTKWGADLSYMSQKLSERDFQIILKSMNFEINNNNIVKKENYIFLTHIGKKMADSITSNLFT